MNLIKLRETLNQSKLEKQCKIIQEFVSNLPTEERKSLAESYEPSKQILIEKNNVTEAGIKLSGRCYISGERIPFTLFYKVACAAAGEEIKSPSSELIDYRKKVSIEMGRTRNPKKLKRVGVIAERKSKRVYGKGRSDNDTGY